MNQLEELSNKNKENYELYLKRMTESMGHSTKGLIPLLVKYRKNILDVGCGSGVMMAAIEKENSHTRITGLDMNIEAISRLKSLNNNWKLYHADFMSFEQEKFDTIIFSSILHEISSYYPDIKKRFTKEPILDAFIKSNELLEDDGIIVLRDGLLTPESDRNNKLIVSFVNPLDGIWLYRFKADFRGFDNLDIDTEIKKIGDNKYIVSEGFLKEFLYTYTWGESSYSREINERFGILTKQDWQELLTQSGFEIEEIIESQEEYEQYLSKRITITELDGSKYKYPNMTIVIKSRKISNVKR